MKRETLNLIELGLARYRGGLAELRHYHRMKPEQVCEILHRLGNNLRQMERDIYASENQGVLVDATNTISH